MTTICFEYQEGKYFVCSLYLDKEVFCLPPLSELGYMKAMRNKLEMNPSIY